MNNKSYFGRRQPIKGPTLDTPLNRINKKIKTFVSGQTPANQRIIMFYDMGRLAEPYPKVIEQYGRLLRIKAAIERDTNEIIAHLSA
ncbi:hypothetical protein AD945_04275 [Gluconobacter albidus]|uniref:Uncharacterized protein n=1 Tax=Gluconobacter albidus TaxID=318683 RepID=A0A149TL54_9PROT|nr:hypothetical protein [Gluconobacter albidus]KXV49424.1 hypothetical protein AD945_04275 [Gluconobacter albidus]